MGDPAKQREQITINIIANLKEQVAKLREDLTLAEKMIEFMKEGQADRKHAINVLSAENEMLKKANKHISEENSRLQDMLTRFQKTTTSLTRMNEEEESEALSWQLQAEESMREVAKLRRKHGRSKNIKKNIEIDRQDIGSQTEASIYYYTDTAARWRDFA